MQTMVRHTMSDFHTELQKIYVCITTLLNDDYDPLPESQREVVQVLDHAAHDLERIWIPLENYRQLQPDEQSRWRHDLGNPINGLLGLSELMMLEPVSEKQSWYLREINRLGKEIYQQIKLLRPVA